MTFDDRNPSSPPSLENPIQVEEPRPGKAVASGLIGPWFTWYEVRLQDNGTARYFIGPNEVPRDVYLDCLATEDKDRYCPECMGDGDDDEGCAHQEPS